MKKNKYEIVIVGAGPAGSTAARYAAENGADVLLIDKRQELGVPVQCGEALSEEVLDELDIEPDPRWAVNKIDKAKLVAPSGKFITMSQKTASKIGYILDRKIFDKQLAILAVRKGADLATGTYVDGLVKEEEKINGVLYRSREEKGEISADIVIAADGVMSRVARWAGFDTYLPPEQIESGVQFKMVDIDLESNSQMEFHFGSKIAPGGYAWVFPKAEDMANVGLGVQPSRAEKKPIKYLKDFVSNKPELNKGHLMEINVGGVPVSGPIKKTYGDKILIVGDAARQVNALTGGGIDWSMRAGKFAGEVAARAVSEGDTSEDNLKEYEELWKERMGEDLERYYMGKEVLLDLSDKELDELADALQDVDFDEISLMDMLTAIMEKSPELMKKLQGIFQS